ncbi:MAG TPA: hypothetical protein VKE74_23695, partial [Gemmataceae bacterium]|nr:hypothetical protein [Gemmataceae bacterium]
ADLYYNAALILTASAAGREDFYARAVGYLGEAVKLGQRPQVFADDPVLQKHLSGRADFARLRQLQPPARPDPQPNLHLTDPLSQ